MDPLPTSAVLEEWAIWYAQYGFAVFPLHGVHNGRCSCGKSSCIHEGKHPRTEHGFHDASTDLSVITRWWSQWPDANIGIATGACSKFFVLDVDPRHGGDRTLAALEAQHGRLPHTPQSLTGGGGEHWCFAMPGISLRIAAGIAPGLDIRADGGYIVAPPSMHGSGRPYAWNVLASLDDTPLAECPSWLLALCRQSRTTVPAEPGAPIPEGQREKTLVSAGGALRYRGATSDEILTAITCMNARCTPPLSPTDLQRIATSVSRYEMAEELDPPVLKVKKSAHQSPEKKWPTPMPWNTLRTAVFPERRWLVKGLIPDGMTIIGGAPKVAKSYVAYDLILATTRQGLALGHFGCDPGPALYMAVEDDQGETQHRVLEVRPEIGAVEGLYFVNATDVPTITEGLYEYVEAMVLEHHLSLVVIDPLMYVYDVPSNKKDPFLEMKGALLPFRQLARSLQFSIIFVDHQRKTSKDDVDIFQTLYGSRAKEAIADSLIMVSRYDNEVRFDCKGRSIKPQVLHFTFDHDETTSSFRWAFTGRGDTLASGALQKKIIQAFKDAEARGRRTLNVAGVIDYAEMLATPSNTNKIRQAMFQMYKRGFLFKSEEGMFTRAIDDDDRGVTVE